MTYFLIVLVVLAFGASIYFFVADHIKRYWIIGFDGRVIVIRGPFDLGEYAINQIALARKDFQEYIIWRRSFSNRQKITNELIHMYHTSRIIRRISSDGYTLTSTIHKGEDLIAHQRDSKGKFIKRSE